jgi:thioredoxin-dependent peroxiredoxin
MKERTGLVTMRGNPVTLLGEELKVGDPAPDFVVLANDLKPVQFASFRGKICVISSVPSLDTPVCHASTVQFNREAGRLDPVVEIIIISMDLPFAQARWCGATGVKDVKTLSDHREASFGSSYGVLMKDLRLLARAVFVVDREGIVQYVEVVKEIANEPDYDAALEAVKKLVS